MAESEGDYNYNKFNMAPFPVDYAGPKPREQFPDFEAVDARGAVVCLSDFAGEFVVLETGSYTCPIYVGNIDGMSTLTAKFPAVQFLVVYTREAHPGEKIGGHKTLEEKTQLAHRLAADYNEGRRIIVDDLEGTVHRMMGGLPNQFYVLNPSGRVMMRGDWIKPEAIEELLQAGDPDTICEQQYFEPRKPSLMKFFGVMRKGGLRAAWDFVVSYPALRRHQAEKKDR